MSTSPITGGASTPLVNLDDPLVDVQGTSDSSGSETGSYLEHLNFLTDIYNAYNALTGLGGARGDTSVLSAELLAELDQLRFDSANASSSALSARIRAAIDGGAQASAQLSELDAQVTAIGAERDDLAAQKADLQAERSGKQSELSDLNSEIAGQQAVIDAQSTLIQQLNTQIADLDASGEPGEHADEIAALETQRDAAVALRNTATSERDALTGQKPALQQAISALNSQIGSLTSAIAAKDQELAAKTAEFEALVAQDQVGASSAAATQAQRLADSAALALALDDLVFDDLRTELGKNQRANNNPIRWSPSSEEREAYVLDSGVKRLPSAYGKARSPDDARQEAEQLALSVVAVVDALNLLRAGAPDRPEPRLQKLAL